MDGSVPSHDILQRFFDISENTAGAVAVHCKVGKHNTQKGISSNGVFLFFIYLDFIYVEVASNIEDGTWINDI